jgi:hypothetical protein
MKVVHFKKEPCDVYVGRPSKWGNPFTHIADKKTAAQFIVASREEAVQKYREWILEGDGKWLLDHLHELEGKTLGCWCCQTPSYYVEGMKMICHGEVLMEILENDKYLEYIKNK